MIAWLLAHPWPAFLVGGGLSFAIVLLPVLRGIGSILSPFSFLPHLDEKEARRINPARGGWPR